jgi:hypothetical protein
MPRELQQGRDDKGQKQGSGTFVAANEARENRRQKKAPAFHGGGKKEGRGNKTLGKRAAPARGTTP